MNVPTPNSEAKKPKQPTWPVNLGIGLATGIILGMLIASWGLRQENWQKAGFETVAAVMLVIVFVITALATFGTAFMRNGFRCSRWAIVIAISILALILIGVELFLEPTRVQRASITKLIVSGAKVLYEKENEPGLAAFFGRPLSFGIAKKSHSRTSRISTD
jgi:membrane protease YdiL (CAAX protease family)